MMLFAPARASVSAASSDYAVCERDDVYLYASPEGEKLFAVPRTYFVRILEREGEFSLVEYGADRAPYAPVRGYCRSAELTPVRFTPTRPYLEYLLEVSYTREDAGGLGTPELHEMKLTVAYYGAVHENGQLYYYVRYYMGGEYRFGRIAYDEVLAFEPTTEYLTAVSGEAEEGAGGALSAAEIVAICLACVAAVAVAVFVARGKRPPVPDAEQEVF